jgi:uncharacterized SAM-binding protein YcdF (DUF218 family)
MLFSEALELLLPMPIYLVGTLSLLAVLAYRGPAAPAPSRRWRWRHGLLAAALWAWVCSTPAVSNAWLRAIEGDPQASLPVQPERSDDTLIVVLGSGEMFSPRGRRQVRLDQSGWERVYGAVSLWRRTGGRLLFTGGPGGDTSVSIAGTMGKIAADLGVPADRIELTADSVSTFEDLKLSRSAIQRATGPVWLVTSAAHMPRALGVTRSLGLSVLPFRVNYRQILDLTWQAWLPHNRGPERFALVLHEAVGALVYNLRDRSD